MNNPIEPEVLEELLGYLQSLDKSSGWNEFVKPWIERQITNREANVSSGLCKTYPEYKEHCGYIQAFRGILDLVENTRIQTQMAAEENFSKRINLDG